MPDEQANAIFIESKGIIGKKEEKRRERGDLSCKQDGTHRNKRTIEQQGQRGGKSMATNF